MANCYFCGSPIENVGKIYKSSTCSSCSGDLKICYNCRFYDASSHWECKEDISEAVREKDRANFCDYFELGKAEHKGMKSTQDDARNKLKSLFND